MKLVGGTLRKGCGIQWQVQVGRQLLPAPGQEQTLKPGPEPHLLGLKVSVPRLQVGCALGIGQRRDPQCARLHRWDSRRRPAISASLPGPPRAGGHTSPDSAGSLNRSFVRPAETALSTAPQ